MGWWIAWVRCTCAKDFHITTILATIDQLQKQVLSNIYVWLKSILRSQESEQFWYVSAWSAFRSCTWHWTIYVQVVNEIKCHWCHGQILVMWILSLYLWCILSASRVLSFSFSQIILNWQEIHELVSIDCDHLLLGFMVLLRSLCGSVEGPCDSKLATIVAKFHPFFFFFLTFSFLFISLSFLSLFSFHFFEKQKTRKQKDKKR